MSNGELDLNYVFNATDTDYQSALEDYMTVFFRFEDQPDSGVLDVMDELDLPFISNNLSADDYTQDNGVVTSVLPMCGSDEYSKHHVVLASPARLR